MTNCTFDARALPERRLLAEPLHQRCSGRQPRHGGGFCSARWQKNTVQVAGCKRNMHLLEKIKYTERMTLFFQRLQTNLRIILDTTTERGFMINLVIKCFLRVQDAHALIPVSGNKGLFYCPCRAPFCPCAERFSQTWLPHSKFHFIHHSLQDHRKRISAYIVRDALPDRI